MTVTTIEALVKAWENSACKQYECADRTADPVGKRVMEHGATVYFNCAQALKAVIPSATSPQPSPIQEEQ